MQCEPCSFSLLTGIRIHAEIALRTDVHCSVADHLGISISRVCTAVLRTTYPFSVQPFSAVIVFTRHHLLCRESALWSDFR